MIKINHAFTFICLGAICIFLSLLYYENLSMQYTEIYKVEKNENFKQKKFDILNIFVQNIHCGYTLEPPHRGMFWIKNKKIMYTPANPSFFSI